MIKVLIVEDSRVVTEFLDYILSNDPDIEVIGKAMHGKEAIKLIEENKPDLVTMDIDMPVMGGLEATRKIMATNPVPILIVTASRNANEVKISMEALAAGALTIIEKPRGIGAENEQELARDLVKLIKLLAGVKVYRRSFPATSLSTNGRNNVKKYITPPGKDRIGIIAVGVSSGGPQVLQKIFSGISGSFPVPIIVVQHIAPGFLPGLVQWLNESLSIPVQSANSGEILKAGHVYLAPDGHQLSINKNFRADLKKCTNGSGLCPSVSHLFQSVSTEFGKKAVAMILTGMGKDGVDELKILHDQGAITIAQDKSSSMIYGMPKVAAELGAATHILNISEIRNFLMNIENL